MKLAGKALRIKLMGGRSECRGWRASAAVAAVLLAACAAHAARDKKKKAEPPTLAPAARIAVAPLGFLAPNPTYLQLRLAWLSLNFIDDDHLLFTFHVNQLLKRTPGDMHSEDDQLIRADVLDIASGKLERTAEWRMYDRGRYIWGLSGGKFLVRRLNDLYLTDSSLELEPYLTFDSDLQGVEISPGRGLMMLEVKKVIPAAETAEADGSQQVPTLLGGGGTKPVEQTRTEMVLLRPGERKALGRAEFRIPRAIPLLEDGIVSMMNGNNPKQWVLQEQTIQKKVETVGQMESDCAPQAQALSSDVVLAMGCPLNGSNGNLVVALKVGGRMLWAEHWDSRYIWPTLSYAQNGSRFAYETLATNREIGEMDSFGEADILAQPVGVFDTETGKLVLVKDADPILSAGQNFALSADGRRFAILRGGAIEVFDLPAVEKQQASESASRR